MVIIISIPLSVTLLLSSKVVQAYVVEQITNSLSEQLGTEVRIGSVKYNLFSTIKLNDIYLEDTENDTLACIQSFYADVKILPLFKKQVVVEAINVDEMDFRLKSDSTGRTNLQFLIDAFTPKEKKKQQPLLFQFQVKDCQLRNCRFKYDNTDLERSSLIPFDPNHIYVDKLNLDVKLNCAKTDTVSLEVNSLDLHEQSGLTISKLCFDGFLGKNAIKIKDFKILMPESDIRLDSLTISYDSLSQLSKIDSFQNSFRFNFSMPKSYIKGNDLACFAPILKGLRNPIKTSAAINYSNKTLRLKDFSASYGNNINIHTSANISDPFNPNETFVYADISEVRIGRDELENLISDLTKEPFILPKEMQNLGDLLYKGNISGFYSNLVAYGRLITQVGVIKTDLMMSYIPNNQNIKFKGKIGTQDFNLNRLLGKDTKLQHLSMNVEVDGEIPQNKKITGKVSGRINSFTYNGYDFNDITIDGNYSQENASADIKYGDENGNGNILIHSDIDFKDKIKKFNLFARVDSIKPNPLKLIDSYPTFKASLIAKSQLQFTTIDDILGYISIDSLSLFNDNESYNIDSLVVRATKENDIQRITISSEPIRAFLEGKYTFSTLGSNLQYLLTEELTTFKPIQLKRKQPSNDFTFSFDISPISELTYVFEKDIYIEDTTFIRGKFSDFENSIELTAFTNNIFLGNKSMDSVSLHIHNLQEKIQLRLETTLETKLDTTDLAFSARLDNNDLDINFEWLNSVEKDFSGKLGLDVLFKHPKTEDALLNLECTLHPSEMILSDSLWRIKEGKILYDEQSLIVNNIDFGSSNQYLRINGAAHKEDNSKIIQVDLKDIDLSYISEVFYMPDIKLLGIVSGSVSIGEALKKPILNADVTAKQFGLNNFPLGDVSAKASFNYEKEQIDLYGEVLNSFGDTSYVHGFVAPVRQEMLLDIDINNLKLNFIKPYLVSFANDMAGTARGKLYVGGGFKSIELWGDAYVQDAMLSIDFLKTKFYFSDSIHIRKDRFILKDITMYDEKGNTAYVNGLVSHKLFNDFKYKIELGVENALILNTTEKDMPDFYGTIYATGGAVINGDMNKVDIAVKAKPEKNSYFAVPINSYTTAADNKFITFVNKNDNKKRSAEERRKRRGMNIAPTTKINVDIAIEATPDVEAQIIFDSHTGDIIKARGQGNLKVNIDNNANVKLFGKYDITKGEYNFSMQGAIRKKFEVGENSSISFDGNPMNGIMDINAMYQTSASLNDLLEESMLTDIKNRTVKVNCIANISGQILEPRVKFDINLPNSDDEVQRRVKSTINTEELMSQQMVFLLFMGKFYNPQVTKANSGNALAASFATSTLSSQLNYWISQISDDVNLGLNYQEDTKDATNNRSFEVNISTNLFDNRLLINGNVGYRTQYGSDDFIGDFDVEYKLNKSGRVRLKSYNHTNDKIYSTALYTQGLGIMYREDFDTWNNLFKYYKDVFRKKTPEEKAVEKQRKEKEKLIKAKEKANRKALREDRKRRHKIFVEEEKQRKQQEKEKRAAEKAARKSSK